MTTQPFSHSRRLALALPAWAFSAALLSACLSTVGCSDGPTPARCVQCGMRTDVAPVFLTGATAADGSELRFDTPKCLLGYLQSPRGEGARAPWVTAYYDQRRVPLDEAHLVVGSDVRGPMGDDLIPLPDPRSVTQFVADHGGRALRPDEVDAALLEGL